MSDNHSSSDRPVNELGEPLNSTAKSSQDQPTTPASALAERSGPAKGFSHETMPSDPTQTTFGALSLHPDQIAAPGFFVNKNLSLYWIASKGTDAFSQALAMALKSATTDNIFSLLLEPAVKNALPEWQAFFSFVYITLRRATTKSTFDTQTGFISKAHLPAGDHGTLASLDMHPFQVDSCMIGRDDAIDLPWRIFSLEFGQGTLFLLRQDQWHSTLPWGPKGDPAGEIAEPIDEKKTICVLSARLDDSHRIADSMLPEGFLNLINRIWNETDGIARSLSGIRVGCSGAQIHYMFTENTYRNPIFSAICCATHINRRMPALTERLKAQWGWVETLCMNMGISHGKETPTASAPTSSMAFVIPGDAFDQSSHLSAIAGKGEIWITKNAVGQLPKKRIDQVVLGIDRQGQFYRNFFKRLSDCPQANLSGQLKAELGTLSIARIVKVETEERIS